MKVIERSVLLIDSSFLKLPMAYFCRIGADRSTSTAESFPVK
jgi:hypothetical protein